MTGSQGRAMRAEAMFAALAAAAMTIVTAATLVSLHLLAPATGAARPFDAGAAVSLDVLAAATRL
ncbi:MAG: hypothetical protein QOG72_1209 [Sphingomonadales bacterium]|nr:hypothetical protein [Sphingomonadales bacterium]